MHLKKGKDPPMCCFVLKLFYFGYIKEDLLHWICLFSVRMFFCWSDKRSVGIALITLVGYWFGVDFSLFRKFLIGVWKSKLEWRRIWYSLYKYPIFSEEVKAAAWAVINILISFKSLVQVNERILLSALCRLFGLDMKY